MRYGLNLVVLVLALYYAALLDGESVYRVFLDGPLAHVGRYTFLCLIVDRIVPVFVCALAFRS